MLELASLKKPNQPIGKAMKYEILSKDLKSYTVEADSPSQALGKAKEMGIDVAMILKGK